MTSRSNGPSKTSEVEVVHAGVGCDGCAQRPIASFARSMFGTAISRARSAPAVEHPLELAAVGERLLAALAERAQVLDDPLGDLVLVVAAAELAGAAGAVDLGDPLGRRAEQLLVAEHVADLGPARDRRGGSSAGR